MPDVLRNSLIYNWIASVGNWFSRQFKGSRIISRFLKEGSTQEVSEGSIFTKLFYFKVRLFRRLFSSLRLDKLLEGSIFKMPFVWCFFAVVLAPVLPTMGVLALTMAGFLSLIFKLSCEKDFKLRYNPLNKYILIYAFVYLAATFTSVNVKGSLYGSILSIAFMLFYFVVINAVQTKKQLYLLTFFFVCFGVLISLYGFYQYLNPSKFSGSWIDTEMFSDIGFRVYSTLGNPNVLGEYLLLTIPLAVSFFFSVKGVLKKSFFVIVGGIQMLCLILTYSRGCWLGILFAAMVFLVLLDRRFILIIIVGLMLMPFVLPETIINRFMSIGNMSDSSTSYRFFIYMGTLSMLKDYWLCGVGPGTAAFNLVYPSYAYDSIIAPHSHNLYLQTMCDAGICGIAMLLAIIYRVFKSCAIGLKNSVDKKDKIFIIGVVASLSGFFVQSMFDYTFYNYRVMFLFWAVVGLAMLYSDAYKLKEE
ncbi:MAG: O-antigen ligase family protein [Candidatus Metalachnospira sp.]|nr:O-antigen ligase family protein [Candidatus Metalachnospira sp.]